MENLKRKTDADSNNKNSPEKTIKKIKCEIEDGMLKYFYRLSKYLHINLLQILQKITNESYIFFKMNSKKKYLIKGKKYVKYKNNY